MSIVQKRQDLLKAQNVEIPDAHAPPEDDQENPLLSTIKIPRSFGQLTKTLPK
jgi:hypothetical protein